MAATGGERYLNSRTELGMARSLTVIIAREGSGYVALCPELDIACQGRTVAAARGNIQEALEQFFKAAPEAEVARRFRREVYVTQVEIAVG